MFTGIIESISTVENIEKSGDNLTFEMSSSISNDLTIDQSVSHNGICLTVESVQNGIHKVTAIKETLEKTNAGKWEKGQLINIERCMTFNGRMDGHIVQGHVDATATCSEINDANGSWIINFKFDTKFAHLMIEKGSICINGISLTCFNVMDDTFSVAIIPYTWQHTNMQYLQPKDIVNIEFDIIGKYLARFKSLAR